jgi:hypothetical protein
MAATRLPRAEHFGVLASAPHSSAAARLDDLSVREDNTLPPEILLPGARQVTGMRPPPRDRAIDLRYSLA